MKSFLLVLLFVGSANAAVNPDFITYEVARDSWSVQAVALSTSAPVAMPAMSGRRTVEIVNESGDSYYCAQSSATLTKDPASRRIPGSGGSYSVGLDGQLQFWCWSGGAAGSSATWSQFK